MDLHQRKHGVMVCDSRSQVFIGDKMPKYKPNSIGLTIHDYILYLKPRGAPLQAIANAYNNSWTMDEALEKFKIWYKNKIHEPRRTRKLSLRNVQNMLHKAIHDNAGELFDRATPEGQLWLERFLEPERQALERRRREFMQGRDDLPHVGFLNGGPDLPHVGVLSESMPHLTTEERQAEADQLKREFARSREQEEKSA